MRIAASEIAGAIENAALLHKVQSHATQLADRVAERTAELEAANRELKTFSYSVSHDLRAPLRKIDGFSQILLAHHTEQLDEEAAEYLQRIRASSQRMGRLIDDLLKLSQVTGHELHRQHVDLSAMARSIANELIHTSHGTELELVIPDDLSAEADPGLLRQVMQNLLDNAIKFTPPGGEITLGSRLVDDHVVLSVQDNGSGIPEDQKQIMTDEFGRMSFEDAYETALVQPGFGLGLAFCKLATDAMKGRIWVDSELGRGSTFSVAFPSRTEPVHEE